MTLGEVLEWIAGVCLVAAAYFWHRSIALALLAAFVFLVYEGHCYGATQIKFPQVKLPKLRRK